MNNFYKNICTNKNLTFIVLVFTFCIFICSPICANQNYSSLQFPIFISPLDTLNYLAVEYFIDGKTLELQGDYTAAITLYYKALEYDDAPGIHFSISLAYYKINKYKEALTEVNKAILAAGDKTEYLIHKANIYIQLNNIDAAILIYQIILEKEPENTIVQYSLARLYEEQNNKQKALELYEQITNNYGFDLNVLNRMYDIYLNYKNFKEASRILEYIMKLDPYDISSNIKLGALYRIIGEYQKSLLVYENLFRLNPNNKDIQTELIKLYFLNNIMEKGFLLLAESTGRKELNYYEKLQVGEIYFNLISQEKEYLVISKNIFKYLVDYSSDTTVNQKWKPFYYLGLISIAEKNEDYNKHFENAIELLEESKIKYADPYSLIGFSYYNETKYKEAKQVAEKGLKFFPDDFRLNFLYGLIFQREGNNEEAIKYFEIAFKKEPENISILSTLALAYNTAGRYSESEEMYERALKIYPDDALVLNNYAYNLAVRGEKLDKALVMAKKAIKKDPKNPNFLDTIGWVYYMLKEYDLALDYILKSIAINAGSAVVQEHLGDVYFELKDITNALKHWKIALELNPQNKNLENKINLINK